MNYEICFAVRIWKFRIISISFSFDSKMAAHFYVSQKKEFKNKKVKKKEIKNFKSCGWKSFQSNRLLVDLVV